jgi:hypothetical protein
MPLGDYGQQLLQQRLPIEQMRGQEAQQQQERAAASQLWQSLYPDQPIPQGIGVKDIVNLAKVTHKAPPGGASAQPPPAQYTQLIGDILKSNQNATADELQQAFDASGIPRNLSASYIETARRKDESKIKQEEGKEGLEMKYHERSEPFVKEVKEQAKQAESQRTATRQMRESIARGDTGYGVFRAAFGSLLPGNLMEQFLSPDEAVFEAAVPNLLEGMKDLFGTRISDADLRLLRGKLPSLGKSPEANEQILDFLDHMGGLKELKYEMLRKEEKKYPKNRPASFERDVEDKYEPEAAKLKDKYFAEFRLPAKQVKQIQKVSLPKNSVRLVSPTGEVIDFSKEDKEDIDTLKKNYNYLMLSES